MATLTALYIFGIVFFAGIIQTITGFGFALVAAPLLTFVIAPKEAVVTVLFIGILMKGFLVYKTWHEGAFGRIFFVFAASVVGALPGAYVLRAVSDGTLKALIGLTLLAATAAMATSRPIVIRRHGLAKTLAGLLSGFFGATTSLNGPPLVLYMMNQGVDKTTIRADLARYFFIGNAATLGIAAFMGSVQADRLAVYAALALPATIFSWWIGQRIFERVDGERFRAIALVVIGASGLVTLGSGLWSFLAAVFTNG
jgi:uncharacterized membrane protein YfcA